jgi:hypothetical protein
MHDRNCADLFLGKFVRAFKVIYFDFAGIRRGPEIFRLRISGVYGGEELIYFFLGQNFCQKKPPLLPMYTIFDKVCNRRTLDFSIEKGKVF